jgi:hypothetical protein
MVYTGHQLVGLPSTIISAAHLVQGWWEGMQHTPSMHNHTTMYVPNHGICTHSLQHYITCVDLGSWIYWTNRSWFHCQQVIIGHWRRRVSFKATYIVCVSCSACRGKGEEGVQSGWVDRDVVVALEVWWQQLKVSVDNVSVVYRLSILLPPTGLQTTMGGQIKLHGGEEITGHHSRWISTSYYITTMFSKKMCCV